MKPRSICGSNLVGQVEVVGLEAVALTQFAGFKANWV